MRSFILITALLLCSLSWISVSVSESQIVDVQPGENVTLLCFLNDFRPPTRVSWSKLVNKTEIICISSVIMSVSNITFCDGFENWKFNMSSNTSTVSLKITQVDLSDSGLYFCRFHDRGYTELQIKYLNVQEQEESDGITKMTSVILGCVTVFLVMVVIGLVVKIRKLQTGCISVSASEFYTVDIQPGDEVTMLCSNFSSFISHMFWFKLTNSSNTTCISSMTTSDSNVSFCHGFQNGKFEMRSNISTLFLKIKRVDLFDSGLYFCGFRTDRYPVIVSATYLKVEEVFDGRMKLMTVILVSLTVFLIVVIIGLVVKIRKPHTGRNSTVWSEHNCGENHQTCCSCISVSASEFFTVDVQPGEQVTLLCSNFSSSPTQMFWFRGIKTSKPQCISSMFQPLDPASSCEGFRNGKFEMRSNICTLFLNIKKVDLTDSGLYFCGYYLKKYPIIVSATYLDVQEVFDGRMKLMTVILVSLTVFLIVVIIGLVVKIRKLHTGWISVSASESQIVDVQPGENVTLLCFLKYFRNPTRGSWSKLVNKTEIICISSVNMSNRDITFCDGFENWKFNMSSNTSTVSLKITQVDLSDSGLYFCSFYDRGHTELQVVQLNVQEQEESDGITKMTSVILGCVTVFLVMVVVGLVVKITVNEEQHPQEHKNLDSDDIKDAALTLYSATIRSRRPASERQVETQVFYAASR
ncbi:hypothetical protein PAMP_015515 [Pampus punctatissimus]